VAVVDIDILIYFFFFFFFFVVVCCWCYYYYYYNVSLAATLLTYNMNIMFTNFSGNGLSKMLSNSKVVGIIFSC
jgi:hypothetical protein